VLVLGALRAPVLRCSWVLGVLVRLPSLPVPEVLRMRGGWRPSCTCSTFLHP